MARKQATGNLRIWFVPTIASTSAPTVAEINAGWDLTGFLRRDGLKRPQDANTVDASDVSSLYNKTATGTYGGTPMELQFYKDDTPANDTAFAQLVPRTTAGYFVIRPFGGSAAVATGNKVEVWTVEIASRSMNDIAQDENQRFTVMAPVTAAPVDPATVA